MPAHRQSALLLHGLSAADRRWVLARVDPADAAVLRAHLRELRELGIPADPALAPTAAPAPSGADPHTAIVARASNAGLQLALGDEPAWVVAQVLALRDWPWRAAFLDGLTEERRTAVTRATPTGLAPHAEAALLAAIATRLAGDGPAPTSSVWNKLRRRA
jgi:hypothetical protein